MKSRRIFWLTALCLFALTALFFTKPFASEKEEAIAKAVANYLVAGRAVIARNQPLINDASKGDKGFTPAVYEAQVSEEFKKITGLDLKAQSAGDPIGKALLDIHASAMEVVAEAQPQINEAGKGFKGFIPAVFGARTGDKFFRRAGIRLKQTSMKFRGDYNRPDEFEEGVLKKMEAGWERGKTYSEVMTVGGRKAVRYMLPIYITKPCLACHGEPAGELDIAGRPKEGYKEGDLRGAISVMVPIRR
jgi:general secretion pathway protein A